MAYTTINKSTDYFNTVLYTGNGSTNAITGVGHQPDWTWIKERGGAENHNLFDAVRGVTKRLRSNGSEAEDTRSTSLTAFGADGFTLGSGNQVNNSSDTYVAWNWKANGSGSANTDGSVNATLSASATAGFSISTFTTPGSGTFTVGHGLGVAPKMIIYRPTTSSSWQVGHDSLGWTKFVALNNTGAAADNTAFGNTAPTSTLWTGNTANVGANAPCIAFCFNSVQGYSKFGSYTGNGNADGPMIYTGFRPAFVIYKGAVGGNAADNWEMADNKRSPFNGIENVLYPNLSNAEGTGVTTRMDFLSNGFKMRTNGSDYNGNGQTYIYMAFGQTMVGSNDVTAKAT